MARYTGPKDRLSRREGYDLFGKGSKLTRLNVPPGIHGPKGIFRRSQYGTELREKQKIKRIYGVLERQFKRYIEKALKSKGNTGEKLLSLLEKRLDNVIYRLHFAPTRPAARQLVSHRKVLVNGAVVNIPSYQVAVGQTVALKDLALKIPAIKESLQEKDAKIPVWLKRKGYVGRVDREPKREDILEPVNEQGVVEFYSR